MAKRALKRLNLKNDVLGKLERNGIHTCQDFLLLNQLQLMKILELPNSEIQRLVIEVSKGCVSKTLLVSELETSRVVPYLSTSLPALDQTLKGGLQRSSITEIAGPSGVGKTQFCILMTLQATLGMSAGGLEGNVIFIDTESSFSPRRLIEMAHCRYPSVFCSKENLHSLAKKVFVFGANSCEGFSEIVNKLETDIISRNVKLVVIDSMASLIRKEFNVNEPASRFERSKMLARYASELKYLAESFEIPILVSNQITTHIIRKSEQRVSLNDDEQNIPDDAGNSDFGSGYVTAALGNTWSHCVNTRLIAQYVDSKRRQLLIAKSPLAPFRSFVYTISAKGLIMEDDEGYNFKGTDPGLLRIRTRSGFAQN